MLPKKWNIKPAAPPEVLARFRDISPVLAQVLVNRALHTPDEAARFLQAELDTRNPFLLKDMSKAVGRIRQAIKRREPIVVYGDFDADGVTSTALLVQALTSLGAVVQPYIPHRIDEGYGLNSDALLKLARSGFKLVITVDCGIRSVEEVEDGRAAGLDIIITDHHSLGPKLPPALAVINPKQEDCRYGEDMLAGVGIAYKLAEALLTAAQGMKQSLAQPLQLEDLVDLVAIGTVADLAPLNRSENRALVRHGLQMLNAAKRPGLRALLDVARVQPGSINAQTIGFAIGPRINAAGRLDSAMTAYELLTSSDEYAVIKLATELQSLNARRQELTRAAQAKIREQLERIDQSESPLIMAGDKGFLPGIVGLVAGRLTEEFYRPSVVMEYGDSESRASCRSIPEFDITRALDQCADLLVRHGGHAQAAGFTIRNENIPAFTDRLHEIVRQGLDGQQLQPTLHIDAEVDTGELSLRLAEELTQLEPTGALNTPPVFVSKRLRVQEVRTVGRGDEHLKLRLMRPNAPPIDAIGFNLGERARDLTAYVDVAYQLDINEYNNLRTAQLQIQDVRPADRPNPLRV
jgi:single-stranded-DNA-specific exonuclease